LKAAFVPFYDLFPKKTLEKANNWRIRGRDGLSGTNPVFWVASRPTLSSAWKYELSGAWNRQ
jgi:hypothetical protein